MAFSIVNFGKFNPIERPNLRVRLLHPGLKECLAGAWELPGEGEWKIRILDDEDLTYRDVIERLLMTQESFKIFVESKEKGTRFVTATIREIEPLTLCWDSNETFTRYDITTVNASSATTECDHDFLLRRCTTCGELNPAHVDAPMTLGDYLSTSKFQRRLHAYHKHLRPQDADVPCDIRDTKSWTPMPPNWYEKTDTSS
jgi:hypothetical protein